MLLKFKPWREKAILSLPILGFIIWAIFTYQVRESVLFRFEENNQKSFLKVSSILEEKALSFIDALQGMGGIVISENYHPAPESIRKYAVFRKFFSNFPGALGFGFMRKVNEADLDRYLQSQSYRQYFKFRQLYEHHGDHYVIEFIEPLERNKEALGLDVASEQTRRNATSFAIDNDIPTLTGPISLVQAEKKGTGFLFLLPLYSKIPHPTSVEERRKLFVGFAYTPILAQSLLRHLREKGSEDFRYNLIDITDQNAPLKLFEGFTKEKYQEAAYSVRIHIGGRTWLFQAVVKDRKYNLPVNGIYFLVLLLGSLFWIYSFFKLRKLILEWKSTEKKAIDIESWQNAVLDGTIYTMVATDTQGTITIFNSAAEKLLGYSSEEMVGKRTPAVFHDKEEVKARTEELNQELGTNIEPGFLTLVTKTIKTGVPDTREWTFVHKNGDHFPVRLTVTAIIDDHEEITGFLEVAEDIREIKKMSELIEEQRATIIHTAKMSALGEMAAGIGHEINNPLSIICSRIFLMKMQQKNSPLTSEDLTDHLNFIEETTFRIASIIKGLKTFSRDSSQEEFIKVSVESIIQDTLSLCQEKFRKEGIEIICEGSLDEKIYCRPVQLSQVFMNLLNNSFDAIADLEERWVKISVKKSPRGLSISFMDSGEGMSDEIAKNIMAPFFTTKEVGKGTGLGLSISRGIIDAHGGKLYMNNSGTYTEFIIELPL